MPLEAAISIHPQFFLEQIRPESPLSMECKPAKQLYSDQDMGHSHELSLMAVLNWGVGEHWYAGHCANSTKKLHSRYKTRSKIANG